MVQHALVTHTYMSLLFGADEDDLHNDDVVSRAVDLFAMLSIVAIACNVRVLTMMMTSAPPL
jgi:hypothetical protein